MDDNALAALKAAYEAATDRPLRADAAHRIHEVGIWQMNGDTDLLDQTLIAKTLDWPMAAFIVAAHEHVPALLAEIERLQRLEATVNQWIAQQEQNYRNTSGSQKNQYYVDAAIELRDALNTDAH